MRGASWVPHNPPGSPSEMRTSEHSTRRLINRLSGEAFTRCAPSRQGDDRGKNGQLRLMLSEKRPCEVTEN